MIDSPEQARAEISKLVYAYCELFDAGRYDEFAELFRHGHWHRAGRGADTARAWIDANIILYDGRPRTKHATTNLVIELDEAAGTATAKSYITVHQAVDGFPLQTIFCGSYRDRFECVDGQWRWVERRVQNDLMGDVSRHVNYHTA